MTVYYSPSQATTMFTTYDEEEPPEPPVEPEEPRPGVVWGLGLALGGLLVVMTAMMISRGGR